MHPNDPAYDAQWHLKAIGNIEKIWDDYDGTGISVGVFDDGIAFNHPDLAAREDKSRPILVPGPYDGVTQYSGIHGTMVAGLIAASGNNGEGGTGVAYGASLAQIDLNRWGPPIGVPQDIDGVLEALRASAQYDVINFSGQIAPLWMQPNANLTDPTSDTARYDAVYADVTRTGRGGLGTTIVQAAGNDDVNANGGGGNASRFSVTVAATDRSGYRAWFSNYGSCVLVTAPGVGLPTTDMPGPRGESPGSYTEFTGTSASAPVVAGVVALMLQADPGLGWRDVQTILAASAVHVGSHFGDPFPIPGVPEGWEHGSWQFNHAGTWNGGGMHIHTDFGYGQVNVYNAVRMAEAWRDIGAPAHTSANEVAVRTGDLSVGKAIPDAGRLSYSFDLPDDVVLDHVDLTAAITHSHYKDLHLSLISPAGTEIQLYDGSGYMVDAAPAQTWTFGVDGLHGERSAGTWTLRVDDTAVTDTGTLDRISLTAYGSAPSPDTVYHYTDEFLAMADLDPSRRILDDRDGGHDWIEAAAMTGDLALDLHPGAVSYAGDAELFQLGEGRIENAIGGDGADRIIGNEGDNILFGGRGNDTLIGAGGSDTLHGDQGDDLLIGSEGDDILDGGAGNDTLMGGGGADTYLFGAKSGDDVILGFCAEKGDRIQLLAGQTFTLDTGWTGDALLRLSGGGTVDLLGVPAFLLTPDAILA
ncbi:S8 family serine peptidase (plasmid) [Methylobacterium currus]|uniref:S8 family serine peptidase n=1 Tax=Methylobacterium currus TaxID=2051553 RepID=UPI001E5DEE34|nr:S8 family serine peptidase [Methylobacterium currus]UHC19945.1 S8 family serine peptidase [Methylobacterium currus]